MMLLNIVDFDPRSKMRSTAAAGDIKVKISGSLPTSTPNSRAQANEAKLKRSLPPASEAIPVTQSTAKRSRLDKGLVRAKPAKAQEAATKQPGAAKAAKLAFESAPPSSVEQPTVNQRKVRGQKVQNLGLDSSDGPDWASVADCLLQEVRDVNKLFREQLDMETPAAGSESVFSQLAIKDCAHIHPFLVSLLTEKLGLEYFTKVQADTLPLVMAGKDVLIKTQTGSGKSLALLLPLVQQLQAVQPPLTRSSGVQALVLCPTHELAEQSYLLLQQLLRPFVRIVAGLLVGGVKRKAQKASLRRGLNILVATPRRLLDHIEHSIRLDLGTGLRLLVIDEADRLLEMGYERDVRQIVEAVCAGGRRPQTLLCSATLSDGAEKLAGLALCEPSSVSEEDALPASVRHHVLAVPTRMRLRALLAAIRALLAAGHKTAVFLPTQASVDFHHALLSALLSDSVALCRLHGNLSHAERIRAFRQFASRGGSGLLVTTDVSARGLDFSQLGWVIQGPGEPQIYCHRAGRTARLGRPGCSLLLLDAWEVAPYLRLLADSLVAGRRIRFAPVPLTPLLADWCPDDMQRMLTGMVGDRELRELAEDAFVSAVRARASFTGPLKAALPMPHPGHLAGGFCLSDPPGVIAGNARQRRHGTGGGGGGGSRAPAAAAYAKRTSRVAGGKRVRSAAVGDRMSEFASGM